MKRAFLFGGFCSLLMLPIGLLWIGPAAAGLTTTEGVAVGLLSFVASIFLYLAFNRVKPGASWTGKIVGAVLGFYAFPAAVGILLAIADQVRRAISN